MGNEQSQLDGSGLGGIAGGQLWGFQVLKNKNTQLAIEPWFDFICGINGRQIDDGNPMLFQQEVRNCVGGAVTLGVWSAKGQRLRDITIPFPRTPASTPLSLGLTLQWAPVYLTTHIWHIDEVSPNSPADHAGLLPHSDYIIGSPDEGGVYGESGMGELVEHYLDRPLRLWVYNSEVDVVREVTITPRRGWGGEGAMGCVSGFGALHRLPLPGTIAPGGTLFESGDGGGLGSSVNPASTATQTYVAPASRVGYAPPQNIYTGRYAARPLSTPPPSAIAHPQGSQFFTPALSSPDVLTRYAPVSLPTPPPPPPPAGRPPALPPPLAGQLPPLPALPLSKPSTPLSSTTPFWPPPSPQTNPPSSPPLNSPQIPHHGHKQHRSRRNIPVLNMDEYMRESEQASLELDRPGSGFGHRAGTPLPPPPKGGIPPPPRRAG